MNSRTSLFVGLLIFVNFILVGVVLGFVPVLLVISVSLNVLAGWFVKKQRASQNEIIDDVSIIYTKIDAFRRHTESLHDLETYYGDEDLQRLIMHARALNNDIVDFQAEHSYAAISSEEELDDSEVGDESEEEEE